MRKYRALIKTDVRVSRPLMRDQVGLIELHVNVSLTMPAGFGDFTLGLLGSERLYETPQERSKAIQFCKRDMAKQLKKLDVVLRDDHPAVFGVGPKPMRYVTTTWKELGNE